MSRQEKSALPPVFPSREYFLNTPLARECLRVFRETQDTPLRKPLIGSGQGWRRPLLKGPPISEEQFKEALVSLQQLVRFKRFNPPPGGLVN